MTDDEDKGKIKNDVSEDEEGKEFYSDTSKGSKDTFTNTVSLIVHLIVVAAAAITIWEIMDFLKSRIGINGFTETHYLLSASTLLIAFAGSVYAFQISRVKEVRRKRISERGEGNQEKDNND